MSSDTKERSKVIAVGTSVKNMDAQAPTDKPEDGREEMSEEEDPLGPLESADKDPTDPKEVQQVHSVCSRCLYTVGKDPVVIITVLAFFIGTGMVLLGVNWAVTRHWSVWVPLGLDLVALFVFFQGELYGEISDDMPAYLKVSMLMPP
jgi:hypothetical protein